MPELPEVESVRRQLDPLLAGRVVERTWFDDHPAHRFHAIGDLDGQRLVRVDRRGKYLVCPLAPGPHAAVALPRDTMLVLHLGMTGSFRLRGPGDPTDPHVRFQAWLDDDRRLDFRDPRRFGRVSVVRPDEVAEVVPTLARLGPEPLSDDFTLDGFAADLAATRSPVKVALLNQRLVAGVGNIYADEALWRARINPHARRVGRDRAARLHRAVRDVLAEAISREGTTFRDYQMVNGQSGRNADFLQAYGQAELPCQRCGTPMSHVVLGGRGTTYCRTCQT
ncbi:bifunctional DNA-formamidopyrimidine glycosylase/DNA-(apurinic or apyrimidinic site) lyase [Salsipaludibacter albus]|uniref:bifunctional DNA-formamidopyrimidine glycosylase/DNA-(apurinic or apyrimidinic site) lyase n=1 Tax=Salsipaludibacter albus TaxID=2849650 RepID=UPI001EE4B1D4|nr:bifunctional DNA-formamidopyrimidine glycosylase/DNA-(apurinic or apyrimidinic site) lyase [Salsipaludibacter albus]MBY5164438.1 bifunctional DNA-formamidopyrimidine glycosylase/DNA-(apurinic or apyrimidinic site) lyase [Salsipaludibacter albus]